MYNERNWGALIGGARQRKNLLSQGNINQSSDLRKRFLPGIRFFVEIIAGLEARKFITDSYLLNLAW